MGDCRAVSHTNNLKNMIEVIFSLAGHFEKSMAYFKNVLENVASASLQPNTDC